MNPPEPTSTTSIARQLLVAALVLFASLVLASCASTRALDPDKDFHYDASYDFSDKKAIVNELSSSLLATSIPGIADDERPTIVDYGIANETSEHINTGGISDAIRQDVLKSQRYRFVNRSQRSNIANETSYQQGGNVSQAERVALGRQLGARYILSGTLRSIEKDQPKQIRLTKRNLIYYSMTLDLTDLETSEIVWSDEVEIAREASRPIIGW